MVVRVFYKIDKNQFLFSTRFLYVLLIKPLDVFDRRLYDIGCFLSAMMETNKQESTTDMLLLEDGTFDALPIHIHRAFEALRYKRPSKMHILRALVFIISLESGFHTLHKVIDFNHKTGCFNKINVEENIKFVCEISQDETVLIKLGLNESENTYKLLTREIGDALCITFSYQNHPGKSIYLSASRYVLNATLKEPTKCFNNLKELSLKLKSNIFTPIRNYTLESNNKNGAFADLIGLPSEVVWLIFRKLDMASLRNLSRTCTQMNSEINNYKNVRGFV